MIVTGRRREEGRKVKRKEKGGQGRTLGDTNTVIVPTENTIMLTH